MPDSKMTLVRALRSRNTVALLAAGLLANVLMAPVCSTMKKRVRSPGACSICTGCLKLSAGKTRWCANPGTLQLSAATLWPAAPLSTVAEQLARASAAATVRTRCDVDRMNRVRLDVLKHVDATPSRQRLSEIGAELGEQSRRAAGDRHFVEARLRRIQDVPAVGRKRRGSVADRDEAAGVQLVWAATTD